MSQVVLQLCQRLCLCTGVIWPRVQALQERISDLEKHLKESSKAREQRVRRAPLELRATMAYEMQVLLQPFSVRYVSASGPLLCLCMLIVMSADCHLLAQGMCLNHHAYFSGEGVHVCTWPLQ